VGELVSNAAEGPEVDWTAYHKVANVHYPSIIGEEKPDFIDRPSLLHALLIFSQSAQQLRAGTFTLAPTPSGHPRGRQDRFHRKCPPARQSCIVASTFLLQVHSGGCGYMMLRTPHDQYVKGAGSDRPFGIMGSSSSSSLNCKPYNDWEISCWLNGKAGVKIK